MVTMPLRRSEGSGNVPLRGVGHAAFSLRPEIRLTQGRMFHPAVRELIVGLSAQHQFRGLEVGGEVSIRGGAWRIVGVFESQGDLHEAEILTGAEALESAFNRIGFQSVSVLLDSANSFTAFKAALTGSSSLVVDVMREPDYYAQQSQSFSRVISVVAYLIGGIMGVGAVFGALNAMYSVISTRGVEIATLRVLGFGASGIVVSVFAEALLLALVGGVMGGSMAWLLFNGSAFSTNAGGLSRLAVPLVVGPGLIGAGIFWACAIGMVGASFPAIRAARAPLASALRGT